ncbi:glycoside hydrolase family 17 protein [Corynascus similis CBS 632.67]
MRPTSALVAAGALVSGASAAENYLGFNSGATFADRSAKFKKDWVAEFKTAQGLENAPGKFNAVRLYTNIQAYSESSPIEAFDAAIETNTKILLGIWTSGTDSIDKEITALKKAIDKHGEKFTKLVIGMSIGSEDLYRDSETGVKNEAGIGAGPDVVVKFINQFKKEVADTDLKDTPIGHVDTWDAWTNSTNKVVIDAVDWVGVDEYPYYEGGKGNDIKNSGTLFDRAFNAVKGAVGDKPIWVTETGWPATGPNWDQAEASVKNAKYYWDEIGCRQLFNKVPTFWYNLRDSNPDNKMKFAITENLSTSPLFDLTCPTKFDTPTSTPSTGAPSSTGVSGPTSSATGGPSSSDGNGTNAGAQTGSEDSSEDPADSGAYVGKSLSAAAVVSLAFVAGVFTLF